MPKKYYQVRVHSVDLAVLEPTPFTIAVPPPPKNVDTDKAAAYRYEMEVWSSIENRICSGILCDFELAGDGIQRDEVFVSEDEPDYGDGADPEGHLAYKLRIIAELVAPRSLEADRNQAIQEFLDKLRSLPESTPNTGES